MTSERVYADYLEDILEAFEKVAQFIQGVTYEQFAQDAKTVFAVIHALEIMEKPRRKCRHLCGKAILKCPGERWLVCVTS